jgi:hypothetical protein
MRFTNVVFTGFKTGISIPEDCDLVAKKVHFKNVGTCYEIRKAYSKTSTQNTTSITDDKLNLDIKNVIQNLYNLEIQSKINKDFEKLNKIRKLKGLIGSKKFVPEYLALWDKG